MLITQATDQTRPGQARPARPGQSCCCLTLTGFIDFCLVSLDAFFACLPACLEPSTSLAYRLTRPTPSGYAILPINHSPKVWLDRFTKNKNRSKAEGGGEVNKVEISHVNLNFIAAADLYRQRIYEQRLGIDHSRFGNINH